METWLHHIISVLNTMSAHIFFGCAAFMLYSVTRAIHVTLAATIALSGYFTMSMIDTFSLSPVIGIAVGCGCAVAFGIMLDQSFYRWLRTLRVSGAETLIISLGIYMIIENLIVIFWGDGPVSQPARSLVAEGGFEILNGTSIQRIHILKLCFAATTALILNFVLRRSTLGLRWSAVSANAPLSEVYGISREKVILGSVTIASLVAALGGLFLSAELRLKPGMGFNPFLYGVTAMLVGGGSIGGVFFGGFVLATAQNAADHLIGTVWRDGIAYVLLIWALLRTPRAS